MNNLFADSGVTIPVGSDGSGKRRAVQLASGEKQHEMQVITAKLALSSALKARVLSSATLDSYKIETNDEFCLAARQGVKLFVDMAKECREVKHMDADAVQEKLGIPDNSAFNEMTKVAIAKLTEAKETEMANKLQATANHWSPQFLMMAVKLCRVEKAFDSKMKKLYIKLDPMVNKDYPDGLTVVQVWEQIEKLMLSKPKNKLMRGVAPPGDLERRLQTLIDAAENK